MLDREGLAIRCVHGDTVLYPITLLQDVVGMRTMEVRGAVDCTRGCTAGNRCSRTS